MGFVPKIELELFVRPVGDIGVIFVPPNPLVPSPNELLPRPKLLVAPPKLLLLIPNPGVCPTARPG